MFRKPQNDSIKTKKVSNRYPKSLPTSRQNSQPKNTPYALSQKPILAQGQKNTQQQQGNKNTSNRTLQSPRNSSPSNLVKHGNSIKPKQVNVKLGSTTKSQDFGNSLKNTQELDLQEENNQDQDQDAPSFSQTVKILLQKQQNNLQDYGIKQQEKDNNMNLQKFQEIIMSEKIQSTSENLLEYSFSKQYNEANEKSAPQASEELYKLNSKQMLQMHFQTHLTNQSSTVGQYQGFLSTLSSYSGNINQYQLYFEQKELKLDLPQQKENEQNILTVNQNQPEQSKEPLKVIEDYQSDQNSSEAASTLKNQQVQQQSDQIQSNNNQQLQHKHFISKSQQTNQWTEIINSMQNQKQIASSQTNSSPSSVVHSRERSPYNQPLQSSPLKRSKYKEINPKSPSLQKQIINTTKNVKTTQQRNSQTSASLPSGTQSREKSPTGNSSPLTQSPIQEKKKYSIQTPSKQIIQQYSSPRSTQQAKSNVSKTPNISKKKKQPEAQQKNLQQRMIQPIKAIQKQNTLKDLTKGAFSQKQNIINTKLQLQKIALAKTKLKELQQRTQLNGSFLDPFEEISSVFGEIDLNQQEESLGSARELQNLLNLAQVDYVQDIAKLNKEGKVMKIDNLYFSQLQLQK